VTYGLISEVETLVARGGGGGPFTPAGKAMEEHGNPRPQFLRTVPAAERMSHEDLVKVANSYFTGLGGNTGHNTAPFAPTCLRWENGAQTNSNPTLRPNGAGGVNIVAMSCEELTLEISELFQIDKGKIDQVEAVINTVPYGMRSAVWD
jgi:hypothetical protein